MICVLFFAAVVLWPLPLGFLRRGAPHARRVVVLNVLSLLLAGLSLFAATRPIGERAAGVAAVIALGVAATMWLVALVLSIVHRQPSTGRGFDPLLIIPHETGSEVPPAAPFARRERAGTNRGE